MTDKQETPSIEAAELPPRSPMEQQIRADPSRHEKILLDTIDALRAKLSAVMVRLSWKEHELNCITRDLTEAGYAPQTIKHQNRDGTPREDEMTTGAVVMFALQDLTQRATEAESRAARAGDAWIPVSERLPKPYVSVLIWRDDIPDFVGPIMAFHNGEKWCNDVMKESYHCTHWMPLPPARKDGEGKK